MTLWSLVLFYTMFAVGMAMLIGGIVAIVKTKWGIVPAAVALSGIYLAFFFPEMWFGPSGIFISQTLKNWLFVHEILGYVAFVALIGVIITDAVFCWLKKPQPLSQRNRIVDAGDAEADDDFAKAQVKREFIGLGVALLLSVIMFAIFVNYQNSVHPLMKAVTVANERGFAVQLNPVLLEVPGEDFPGLDNLKLKAAQFAKTRGLPDLKFEHVFTLGFAAQDNNEIDELIIVFNGTYLKPGAPGRRAIAANPALGNPGFPAVPAGREALDRVGIAVPQEKSYFVTSHYSDELVQQYRSRTPVPGMGFSYLGDGRPTFTPSPLGGSPIIQPSN